MGPVDWTAAKGCERCAEHGPSLPGGTFYVGDEDARTIHQDWHALAAALLALVRVPRFVAWVSRRMT